MRGERVEGMGIVIPIAIFLVIFTAPFRTSEASETIELKNGPEDLAWVVQLSDLYFSGHHPDRAHDFREIVGPTLSFIKPALVLTGDLTASMVFLKEVEMSIASQFKRAKGNLFLSGLTASCHLFCRAQLLLTDINSELSQWDYQSFQPVTKLSFGHFHLSFSDATKSGKTLKDSFLVHSLSAYLCGHLHTKFGNNFKRYHSSHHQQSSKQLFQLSS
ncbi:putative metallophosphoesterase At3g03305 [Primulina huaijiensis]|uniref:putative metallophosphoesterase At3g03305 n=1 Tax=Primulina huaijiensis TaxID=1492673 RepID=UPI003CC771DA